jgi:hypothetical protein
MGLPRGGVAGALSPPLTEVSGAWMVGFGKNGTSPGLPLTRASGQRSKDMLWEPPERGKTHLEKPRAGPM